jgi:hypothetical protein
MRALPDTAMPSGGPVMGQSTLDQLRTSLGHQETATAPGDLTAPALAPRLPATSGPLASPHLLVPTPLASMTPVTPPAAAPLPAAAAPVHAPAAQPLGQPLGQPQAIPFRSEPQGLLDRASPPFIEGDFIAAVRRPDGHWTAVAPVRSPSPTAGRSRCWPGSSSRW